jgi:hypothetical protein
MSISGLVMIWIKHIELKGLKTNDEIFRKLWAVRQIANMPVGSFF